MPCKLYIDGAVRKIIGALNASLAGQYRENSPLYFSSVALFIGKVSGFLLKSDCYITWPLPTLFHDYGQKVSVHPPAGKLRRP